MGVAELVRRPGFLATLSTGVSLGAIAAITRLGPHPFSLRGLEGILVAGGAFGATLAVARYAFGNLSRAALYSLLPISGAVGGIVWWLMLSPQRSVVSAALLGALLAEGVVSAEAWLRRVLAA